MEWMIHDIVQYSGNQGRSSAACTDDECNRDRYGTGKRADFQVVVLVRIRNTQAMDLQVVLQPARSSV